MGNYPVNRRRFVQGVVSATVTGGVTSMNNHTAANGDMPERAKFREHLLRSLGGPWPEPCPLEPEITEIVSQEAYRIEHLSFLAEPDDRIPALLLVPEGVDDKSPAPGICIWHQHAGKYELGKSEPAGLGGNPMHFTGVEFAKLGYVVLCIDAIGFEDRQNPELANDGTLDNGGYERYLFLRYLVEGRTLAWKNILDMRRAADYLQTRAEIIPDQLGCYGHSMGSTHTWLVGGWEPRYKALVGNCCLPTYRGIHREQLLHCFPNFVPNIYPAADTPDIAALIAPRPFHLNFGEHDSGSPIDEARRGAENIAEAYRKLGAKKNFSYYIEDGVGHVLSDMMWQKTHEFFARHLPISHPFTR
jgi:dienelactone hydrolase